MNQEIRIELVNMYAPTKPESTSKNTNSTTFIPITKPLAPPSFTPLLRPQSPRTLKAPTPIVDSISTNKSNAPEPNNGITIVNKNFYGTSTFNPSKPSIVLQKVELHNEMSSSSSTDSTPLTASLTTNNSRDTGKRRRMNSSENFAENKKPPTAIAKALTSKRGAANNSNFNNKNPRFDQENLENTNSNANAKNPSASQANSNGSIKTWNRTNSMTKPAGKGYNYFGDGIYVLLFSENDPL